MTDSNQYVQPANTYKDISLLAGSATANSNLISSGGGNPTFSFALPLASNVQYTPALGIGSTNIQGAITELSTEKLGNESVGMISTAPFSVPNNAWTNVTTGGSVQFTNGTFYTTGGIAFTITENTTLGNHLTLITVRATFDSSATGMRGLRIQDGGLGVCAAAMSPSDPGAATQVTLNATLYRPDGLTYTLQAFQNSGGALNIGSVIGGFDGQTTYRAIFLGTSS